MKQLTAAEAERLALLAEECAEVIQAATKILRHGYESYNPDDESGPNNRFMLASELGDVQFAIDLLVGRCEVDENVIASAKRRKAEKWAKYSHHQATPPAVAPVESLTEDGGCARCHGKKGEWMDKSTNMAEDSVWVPCPKCAPGEGGK